MTIGLALGKFAPLHKGHELLLNEASKQTDEQIFVIYDSPQATSIPLRVRSNWIRKLYPRAKVIEAWGGPKEVGLDPDLTIRHEDYLVELLRDSQVTHFFSSEPYGDHISKRLGAKNVLVDSERIKHPISSSQINKALFDNREFLSPIVYSDLILKVVFLGAPGSGKSTITELCAQTFRTEYMPEYGREYWETHNVNRRLTMKQLNEIARLHRQREDLIVRNARDYFFIDTDASSTSVFSNYYHNDISPTLNRLAHEAIQRYDLTFLCNPDFPYIETEDRSGEVIRSEFHERILDDLRASKRPYFELSGSLESRLNQVQDALQQIKKYGKIINWSPNA